MTSPSTHRPAGRETPSIPVWLAFVGLTAARLIVKGRHDDPAETVAAHEKAEPGRGRGAKAPTDIPAPGWKDILWRVYGEVDELMSKMKVDMHKMKATTRKYAFELPGIPKEGQYMKVLYPYTSKSKPRPRTMLIDN